MIEGSGTTTGAERVVDDLRASRIAYAIRCRRERRCFYCRGPIDYAETCTACSACTKADRTRRIAMGMCRACSEPVIARRRCAKHLASEKARKRRRRAAEIASHPRCFSCERTARYLTSSNEPACPYHDGLGPRAKPSDRRRSRGASSNGRGPVRIDQSSEAAASVDAPKE